MRRHVLPIAIFSLATAALTATPASAASPSCGATLTTDTTMTRSLTCSGTALTLTSGVTLDLAGHSIVGSGAALTISGAATAGTTTIKNGVLRGIAVNATSTVELDHVQVAGGSFAINDGSLTARDSTLNSVKAAGSGSHWNLERSKVRGDWFTGGGSASIVDSVVTDTTPEGSAENWYRPFTMKGSTIRGARNRLNLEDATVSDSTVTGTRGISTFGANSFSNTTFRSNTGDSALSVEMSGGLTVDRSTFVDNDFGVRGGRITNSTFLRNRNGAVAGVGAAVTTAVVSNSTFRSNGGPTTVGAQYVELRNNLFTRNTGTAISAQYGDAIGNTIRYQDGDGIYYGGGMDPESSFMVKTNTILNGTGWGIRTNREEWQGDDIWNLVDGGGNVARGNAAGQCMEVSCSTR